MQSWMHGCMYAWMHACISNWFLLLMYHMISPLLALVYWLTNMAIKHDLLKHPPLSSMVFSFKFHWFGGFPSQPCWNIGGIPISLCFHVCWLDQHWMVEHPCQTIDIGHHFPINITCLGWVAKLFDVLNCGLTPCRADMTDAHCARAMLAEGPEELWLQCQQQN